MHTDLPGDSRRDLPFRSLLPFLALSFGLSWGVLVALALFSKQLALIFGELSARNPLFILAVYAPAIAAFIVVLRHGGFAALRRYLSRLLLWRCSPACYLLLLVGIPLIFIAGSLLKGNLFSESLPFAGFGPLLTAMAFMLLLGPVEEFGWRGLALPLLQRRLAPAWAGLVLGLVWGVWHLPAFFLSGTPQSAWGFMPFLLGVIAISIILTLIFNASGGSILLAALAHFQFINPLWPDAQPYDSFLFLGLAILLAWLNRKTMFSRGGAVTTVIPGRAPVNAVNPSR